MYMSEHIDKLAEALAKAQPLFPTIPKESVAKISMKAGGNYSFKFANLPTVIENVKKILGDHALSYSQIVTESEMITLLMHASGQWLKSIVSLTRTPDSRMQDYGAQITYLRRYALSSILGVCADEDPDSPAFEKEESVVAPKKVVPMGEETAHAIRCQLGMIEDPGLEGYILQTAAKKFPALKILRIEDIPDTEGKFINEMLTKRIEADDKARRSR